MYLFLKKIKYNAQFQLACTGLDLWARESLYSLVKCFTIQLHHCLSLLAEIDIHWKLQLIIPLPSFSSVIILFIMLYCLNLNFIFHFRDDVSPLSDPFSVSKLGLKSPTKPVSGTFKLILIQWFWWWNTSAILNSGYPLIMHCTNCLLHFCSFCKEFGFHFSSYSIKVYLYQTFSKLKKDQNAVF